MPPTDEIINDAAQTLSQVRLESFSLDPDTIVPFQRATLSWRVSVEGFSSESFDRLQIRLIGPNLAARVPLVGTRNVSPSMSGTYTLKAFLRPFSKVLATRAIQVNTSDCIDGAITEADVLDDIREFVDDFLEGKSELKRRNGGESVSIGTPGIKVRLRFKVEINNWADPDINADALIKIHAQGGQIRHNLSEFEFDIDFPWWADLAHGAFLPAWLSIALREGNQGREVRELLDNGVANTLAGHQAAVEAVGYRFLSASTEPDQDAYTICPAQNLTTVGLFTTASVVSP